jgi:ureidoacrylate peracid hydrolase
MKYSATNQTPLADLPVSLADKLALPGAALVIIDMQNDFCAPGGYIDKVMGKSVASAATIVASLEALVESARATGVPVVWVGADYSADKLPDSMRVKLMARGIQAECCKPGTWGAEWFGVKPAEGEPVVLKNTYSGFANTELPDVLAKLDVRTLVFGGVQTQICVESTVRSAHSEGYFCVVPEDAVASHTPHLHAATLDNIRFLFGDVCTNAEVISAWAASPKSN